jgi:hypothetical protein
MALPLAGSHRAGAKYSAVYPESVPDWAKVYQHKGVVADHPFAKVPSICKGCDRPFNQPERHLQCRAFGGWPAPLTAWIPRDPATPAAENAARLLLACRPAPDGGQAADRAAPVVLEVDPARAAVAGVGGGAGGGVPPARGADDVALVREEPRREASQQPRRVHFQEPAAALDHDDGDGFVEVVRGADEPGPDQLCLL